MRLGRCRVRGLVRKPVADQREREWGSKGKENGAVRVKRGGGVGVARPG